MLKTFILKCFQTRNFWLKEPPSKTFWTRIGFSSALMKLRKVFRQGRKLSIFMLTGFQESAFLQAVYGVPNYPSSLLTLFLPSESLRSTVSLLFVRRPMPTSPKLPARSGWIRASGIVFSMPALDSADRASRKTSLIWCIYRSLMDSMK